ncbi:MAG: 2-dehydropantoate 2-reductase N-terminal domain-containing protein, partial [Verrucomicrobiota bacterium]
MFPDKPKIAVVGSGALGGYYGCLLARSGCDVHFLLRSDYVTVRDQGYRIVTPEDTFTLDKVQAYTDTGTIGACDLVVVAVKSTANDALEPLVTPLVDEHTLVLTLQNGLGNAEHLSQFVPATQLLAGLCFV